MAGLCMFSVYLCESSPHTPAYSKDMHVGLLDNSKLSLGVNLSMSGCLFLCGSGINWQLVHSIRGKVGEKMNA